MTDSTIEDLQRPASSLCECRSSAFPSTGRYYVCGTSICHL